MEKNTLMFCEICQKTYSSELFSNVLAGNISGLFLTSFIHFKRSNGLSVFALSLLLVICMHVLGCVDMGKMRLVHPSASVASSMVRAWLGLRIDSTIWLASWRV